MATPEAPKSYIEHLIGAKKIVISGIKNWEGTNPDMLAQMAGGFAVKRTKGGVELTADQGMDRVFAGGFNAVLTMNLLPRNPRMEVVTF